jgi:hypothetical protein
MFPMMKFRYDREGRREGCPNHFGNKFPCNVLHLNEVERITDSVLETCISSPSGIVCCSMNPSENTRLPTFQTVYVSSS